MKREAAYRLGWFVESAKQAIAGAGHHVPRPLDKQAAPLRPFLELLILPLGDNGPKHTTNQPPSPNK